jgi:mRNA interferase MazF
VVVGRQTVVDSKFSTVVCAPVLSRRDGLATQVDVSLDEGLKHDSSIHCDALVSVSKAALTNYVGRLSRRKLEELADALRVALAIE